jgi:hypothetical protein
MIIQKSKTNFLNDQTGMTLFWPLIGSGTVDHSIDLSVNSYYSNYNTPLYSNNQIALSGNGAYFDGTKWLHVYAGSLGRSLYYSQFLFTGEDPGGYSKPYSFDFWYKKMSNGALMVICSMFSGSDPPLGYRLFFDTDNIMKITLYSRFSGTATFSGATAITDQNWHHYAVTRDGTDVGSKIYFFIDGVLDSSPTADAFNGGDPAWHYDIGWQWFIVGSDRFSSNFDLDVTAGSIAYVNPLIGYLKNFRFSINYTRWISGFTPPTSYYQYLKVG